MPKDIREPSYRIELTPAQLVAVWGALQSVAQVFPDPTRGDLQGVLDNLDLYHGDALARMVAVANAAPEADSRPSVACRYCQRLIPPGELIPGYQTVFCARCTGSYLGQINQNEGRRIVVELPEPCAHRRWDMATLDAEVIEEIEVMSPEGQPLRILRISVECADCRMVGVRDISFNDGLEWRSPDAVAQEMGERVWKKGVEIFERIGASAAVGGTDDRQ